MRASNTRVLPRVRRLKEPKLRVRLPAHGDPISAVRAMKRFLSKSLQGKAYRDAFVRAEIATTIALQIKALRKARGWNQGRLAGATEMTQGRISLLENPDYEGAVNVRTLEHIASAFDIGLVVRFAPFSEIVDWTSTLTASRYAIPDFAHDNALQDSSPSSPALLPNTTPILRRNLTT